MVMSINVYKVQLNNSVLLVINCKFINIINMFSAIRVCGIDCLLSAEWKSPNKIIARTGQIKTKGDIIVVTRSGGVGNCTVQFRGYLIHIGMVHKLLSTLDVTKFVFR